MSAEISFDSKRMRGRGSYVWVNIDAKTTTCRANDDALTTGIEGPQDHGVTLSSRSVLLGRKTRWAF